MERLTHLVSCAPISFQWDPAVKFHCINQVVLVRTDVVTDVIIDGMLSIT